MVPRFLLAITLAFNLLVPASGAAAQTSGVGTVSTTATLSILAGNVRHVPAGEIQPRPAADGMNLAVGDRVLTAPDATALVTFLDGSTLTIQPDSDVAIKTAEVAGLRSIINIQINLGTVWARLARLFDSGSTFTLESDTASATFRSSVGGGQQNADGSFVCWTRGGEMVVQGKQGQAPLTLQPGQATTVQPGQDPAPRPFFVNQSALRISAPSSILPLVVTADRARVAGFVAPGVEVNQVFGSFTGVQAGNRLVEIPAGAPGPYRVVLEGQQDGPFDLKVAGLFQGAPVYEQDLAGSIRAGERLAFDLTQQIDPATAADPRTARVTGGSGTSLQPYSGPLPGKILLAPGQAPPNGKAAAAGTTWGLVALVALLVLALVAGGLHRGRSRPAGSTPATSS